MVSFSITFNECGDGETSSAMAGMERLDLLAIIKC